MDQLLENLSIRQKIGQLFFVGVAGTTLDDGMKQLFDEIVPGGVCLFTRNIREAGQTRKLLDDIRDHFEYSPFLSLDQEGGLVDRLRRIVRPMPPASAISDAQTAEYFGRTVAEIIRILGFNMDFAPVLDVITPDRESGGNGLYSRGFGRRSDETCELAGAFLEALQLGGCLGCVKHFPGLGAATVDSHEELPIVAIGEPELRSVDLAPYKELFDRGQVHSVMIAHAAYPNSSWQETASNKGFLPSSLSRRVITELLRRELCFDALVITDDLEMGAIVNNYGIGEASVLAIEAGADMLTICADGERIKSGFTAVFNAVSSGRISESRLDESLARITKTRSLLHEPLPFDTLRLAELSEAVSRLNGKVASSGRDQIL